MGGEWDGEKLGTLGDIGFFSLGRGKAISTVEGGIIFTNDRVIAERITKQIEALPDYVCIGLIRLFFYSIILMFFLRPSLFWFPKAIPFLRIGETIYDPDFFIKKMSPYQAGLARDWQNKIKKFKKSRALYTKQWTKNLYTVKCENFLTRAITHNPQFPDLLRFPVVIRDDALRKRILEESERYGLGIMPGYPDSINGIHELKNGFVDEEFPVAKEVAKKLITLPIHPFVNSNDEKRISGFLGQLPPVKRVA